MRALMIRKGAFAAGYLVLAVIIEMITFSVMGLGVVPEYFGLDMAVILMLAFVLFILPFGVAQAILFGLLLLVQIVLSVANEALYSMSGMVFSFGMLNLANEVAGVFDASFLSWGLLCGLLALYIAAVAGAIVLLKKVRVEKGVCTRGSVLVLLTAFFGMEALAGVLYGGLVHSFSAAADESASLFSDEEMLYEDQLFSAKAFQKFGTFGYSGVNISNAIAGHAYSDGVTEEEVSAYFAEGQMSGDLWGDNIYTGAAAGKNIVLIVIESGEWYAINQDYTPTLYAMATQGVAMTDFHARDKTNCSEALSVMGSYPSATKLEPSNVTGNTMPYTLPNILRADGYTANYFHANDGSYYKRKEVFPKLFGFDHTYFLEDMPLLDGYAHKTKFYDMDKDSEVFRNYAAQMTQAEEGGAFYMQMMTLTTHGRYEDLINYGNYPYTATPPMENMQLMTAEEQAEFSKKCEVQGLEEYYRLIDGFPTQYVEGTLPIDEDYLRNTGTYKETFLRYKRYQAAMSDLDRGVNYLVRYLEEKGELGDTLFLFYADHSAYYDQMNYLLKGIGSSENYNTDVYKVPCFLWYGGSMDLNVLPLEGVEGHERIDFAADKDTDSPLQSGQIGKYTNTYDILPTLLHLTGHSYNTNLYHGESMFTDKESLFVSHESGIFADDIYFNAIDLYQRKNGVWTRYDYDETIASDGFDDAANAFLAQAEAYYEKQKMLDAAIGLDYFAGKDFYGSMFIEKLT